MRLPLDPEGLSAANIGEGRYSWDVPAGKLAFFDIPSVLFWMDPSLKTLLLPFAQRCGPELFRLLVARSSSFGTEEDYEAMVTILGETFDQGFLKWGEAVSTAGWGHFSLPEYDPERCHAVVKVENAWERRLQQGVPEELRWGCPFLQGKIIGLFSRAFGVTCWADEAEGFGCEADDVAFRVYRSPQTIETEIERVRNEQLEERERALKQEIANKTRDLLEAQEALRRHAAGLEDAIRDRTQELQQSNIQLREAKAKAEQINELKSLFLASMSHEIRTPLNAVIGLTSILRETKLTDEQRELVEGIDTSGDFLLAVIDDVLDLSKIEAGRVELERAPFAPRVVLAESMGLVRLRATEKGLNLLETVDDAVPAVVIGDAARFRQVLVNLLGNAVKFTERGEVEAKLTCARDGNALRLIGSVRDTGIGLTDEARQRLFEPFSQGDPSMTRRFGGSGLGLSISKRLCHLMGGDVTVESTPGVGSTFRIEIQVELASDDVRPEPASDAAVSLAPLTGRRVLVAEDNPMNQRVAEALLGELGVEVTLVKDGRQALSAFSEHSFDAILMDMHMPELDGIAATSEIRALEAQGEQPRTPVIALTAGAMPDDERRCFEAGVDAFLSKPVRLDQLRSALGKLLG